MSETTIRHFPQIDAAPVKKQQKARTSVTVSYGKAFRVRFGDEEPRVLPSEQMIARIARQTQLTTNRRMPRIDTPQERQFLIAMLNLDQATVQRIDANAEAMNLTFAEAISAELKD